MFSARGSSQGLVDRPLSRGKQEVRTVRPLRETHPLVHRLQPDCRRRPSLLQVSLSAFAYLFSELVQYCQARVSNIGELERRLDEVGYGVGRRLLEVLTYRERACRRETRLLDALKFVHSTVRSQKGASAPCAPAWAPLPDGVDMAAAHACAVASVER